MQSFSMAERHRQILSLVQREGRISIAELIAATEASPATIRRDVTGLVAGGALKRVRGGVFWPEHPAGELPHERRSIAAPEAKRAIAREAARLVPPKASVFIDSGTTCAVVAEELCQNSSLTLYTSSLALATILPRAACRIVFLGGECRPVSLALVGALAEEQISRLRPDLAFIGATGVHPKEGLFTTDTNEAGVKARAVANAARVILVADATKAGQRACVHFSDWKRVQTWVTDSALPSREIVKYPVEVRRAV